MTDPAPPPAQTPAAQKTAATGGGRRAFWSRRQNLLLLALATILMAVFLVRLSLERGWGREAVTIDAADRDAVDPRLDVNTAGWPSLARLPGLGPKTAQRLVAEREAGGPFDRPEALAARVEGIGPGTMEKCRPYLRFPCDTRPASRP